MTGSIALLGGRLDELSLKDYRETLEPESDIVSLLTPRGSQNPYYALYGWAPGAGVSPSTTCPAPTPSGGWNAAMS